MIFLPTPQLSQFQILKGIIGLCGEPGRVFRRQQVSNPKRHYRTDESKRLSRELGFQILKGIIGLILNSAKYAAALEFQILKGIIGRIGGAKLALEQQEFQILKGIIGREYLAKAPEGS